MPIIQFLEVIDVVPDSAPPKLDYPELSLQEQGCNVKLKEMCIPLNLIQKVQVFSTTNHGNIEKGAI